MALDATSLVGFLLTKGISTETATHFVDTVPERVQRVANGDSVWSGHTFYAAFNDFLDYCPEWAEKSSDVVIFFDNPAYSEHMNLKSVRYQGQTRICGAHAAVQWLHYLLDARNSEEINPDAGTVDIAKYIASTWEGKDLIDYLKGNKRIDALNFFRGLTRIAPGNLHRFCFCFPYEESRASNDAVCLKLMTLVAIEPGMVIMLVPKGFLRRDGPVTFTGDANRPGGETSHAMLLIGIRFRMGLYFLVFQNWHMKQFIEVSAEYFASCEGAVYFVRHNTPVHISRTVPILYEHSIEIEIEGDTSFEEMEAEEEVE